MGVCWNMQEYVSIHGIYANMLECQIICGNIQGICLTSWEYVGTCGNRTAYAGIYMNMFEDLGFVKNMLKYFGMCWNT